MQLPTPSSKQSRSTRSNAKPWSLPRVVQGMALVMAAALLAACGFLPGEEASTSGNRQSATPTEGPLKLMTLNAEFLWDGVKPEEGEIDFPWRGSQAKAEAHMEKIAKIIRRADADLVNLAEVENLQALETLNEKFLGGEGYRPYFVSGTDTATGQDVALLSRFEVLSLGRDPRKGRSGKTRKSVSKHYVAKLDVAGLKLGLVGLHLLAKPTQKRRVGPREAQADSIRRMAQELSDQGRSVIVWGDFNDFDGEVLDRRGSRPISRVLEWIRELDPKDEADDLINVAVHLDRPKRQTSRRGDSLDHILLSRDLAARIEEVEIFTDIDPTATRHYPIIVSLRTGPSR